MAVTSPGPIVGPWMPLTSGYGAGIYAELMPAPPLTLPWRRGRSWKDLRGRWWFEILSERTPADEDNPEGLIGTHYWMNDGGAFTLRRAVREAMRSIQLVIQEIDADELEDALERWAQRFEETDD